MPFSNKFFIEKVGKEAMWYHCKTVDLCIYESSSLTQNFNLENFTLNDMNEIFPRSHRISENKMGRYLSTNVFADKYICNVPLGHIPTEKEMREIYDVFQNCQLWKQQLASKVDRSGVTFHDWTGRDEVRKMYLDNKIEAQIYYEIKKDRSLLEDLLQLCDDALNEGRYTFDDFHTPLNFPLELDKDYDISSHVIKLCNKYGLLMWQDDIKDVDMYRKTIGARKGAPPANYSLDDSIFYCFSITSFIEELLQLFGLYLVWQIITENSKAVMETAKNVLGYFCFLNQDRILSQQVIENYLAIVSKQTSFSTYITMENGKPEEHTLCKNPMEAAMAQMLSMIAEELRKSRQPFETCSNPECKSVFYKNHGNKRLCPKCDSGIDRVRIHRVNIRY